MNTHTTHTPDVPEIRRLQRSRSDRMVAGVSGGLARYFEIHPAVFRVGFVVLTLLGGAGVLIYAAAALVMPDEGKEDSIATAALRNRRDRPWPLIGLGLLAVGGAILLSRATLWPNGDAWWLFLVAGGRDPLDHPAPCGRSCQGRDGARSRGFPPRAAAAAPARRSCSRRSSPSCSSPRPSSQPCSTCTSGVASATATYAVTNVQELESDYRLGIGSLELDLGALQLPEGETHVDASVDVGDLQVIVPDGRRRCGCTPRQRPAYVEVLEASAMTAATPSSTSSRPATACSCSTPTSALGAVRVERAVR